MDDYMKEAMGIVRAQAAHRTMTADEMLSMVKSLSASLMGMATGDPAQPEVAAPTVDGKKSIKENSVTCLECGKVCKVLTARHLVKHGLTADEYRAKYGLKKGTSLASKSLSRARKTKMAEMKLWERRKKVDNPAS